MTASASTVARFSRLRPADLRIPLALWLTVLGAWATLASWLAAVPPALTDREAESRGVLRIVDESGEDYLFPARLFVPVDLPPEGGSEGAPVRSDPDTLSGSPVFAGTRVPLRTLMDYLEAGDGIDHFLSDFPTVRREQVEAVLQAADSRRTRAPPDFGSIVSRPGRS